MKIFVKKANQSSDKQMNNRQVIDKTLSDLNIPVFVMCPPIYAKFEPNNIWMEEAQNNNQDVEINTGKFMYEWSTLQSYLSVEGIVLTLPPRPDLPDEVYVNSFAFLPHIEKPKTCLISRFKAKGRQGEEKEAYDFLTRMGYVCYQPPEGYYWEGEACLKWLRDNIYIGSYGVRNTKEAYKWMEKNFDMKVIVLCKENEYLYHTDCLVFPITPFDVLVATKHADKKALKELEKYANVIPIEDEDLLMIGIMNSISVGYTVFTADNEDAYLYDDDLLKVERKKRQILCEIATDLGMEVVFIPFTEALKQGALLSCAVTRLNYADKYEMIMWRDKIVKVPNVLKQLYDFQNDTSPYLEEPEEL